MLPMLFVGFEVAAGSEEVIIKIIFSRMAMRH